MEGSREPATPGPVVTSCRNRGGNLADLLGGAGSGSGLSGLLHQGADVGTEPSPGTPRAPAPLLAAR